MAERTRIGVKIMPREVILDTQGRAIEQTLKLNGLPEASCRVGRFVELDLQVSSEKAKVQAEEIANKLLCNPLIETFEIKEL
ncbi:MAG: phosphoribosylformylglycinamidine synthase subunit PurS [Pseudobdellovibrionaceae bacterium]